MIWCPTRKQLNTIQLPHSSVQLHYGQQASCYIEASVHLLVVLGRGGGGISLVSTGHEEGCGNFKNTFLIYPSLSAALQVCRREYFVPDLTQLEAWQAACGNVRPRKPISWTTAFKLCRVWHEILMPASLECYWHGRVNARGTFEIAWCRCWRYIHSFI